MWLPGLLPHACRTAPCLSNQPNPLKALLPCEYHISYPIGSQPFVHLFFLSSFSLAFWAPGASTTGKPPQHRTYLLLPAPLVS